jgi:hypothetical protein
LAQAGKKTDGTSGDLHIMNRWIPLAGRTEKDPARGRRWICSCLVLLLVLVTIPPVIAGSTAVTMAGTAGRQGLQPSYLIGDINHDGLITSLDALMALQMSTGKIPPDLIADANGDGKITAFDAAQILRISTGLLPAPGIHTGEAEPVSNSTEVVMIVQDSLVKNPVQLSKITVVQTLVAVIPTTHLGGSAQTVAFPFRCVAGYTLCGDGCLDLAEDSANCGSCGHACLSGYTCTGGNCMRLCSAGLTSCNNGCVDLLADAGNCGSCSHICMAGATCSSGQCVVQMVTTQPTRLGGIGKPHL